MSQMPLPKKEPPKNFYTLVMSGETKVVVIRNGKDRVYTRDLQSKILNITPCGENQYTVSALVTTKDGKGKVTQKTEMIVLSITNGVAKIVRRWKV